MTIEDAHAYVAGLWDWSALAGCFNGVRPTDLDGLVERRGQFLAFETKVHGPRSLPRGQAIAFEALRRTGYFTVVVIWGRPGRPVAVQVWARDGIGPVLACDLAGLRRLARRWWVLVEAGQPVCLASVNGGRHGQMHGSR